MATAVFAKVTHTGRDYATIELTVQTADSKHPERSFPKVEIEVPRAIGDWLKLHGANDKEETFIDRLEQHKRNGQQFI